MCLKLNPIRKRAKTTKYVQDIINTNSFLYAKYIYKRNFCDVSKLSEPVTDYSKLWINIQLLSQLPWQWCCLDLFSPNQQTDERYIPIDSKNLNLWPIVHQWSEVMGLLLQAFLALFTFYLLSLYRITSHLFHFGFSHIVTSV